MISLEATPFRPGELPVISWLVLDPQTRDLIESAACDVGVPPELWVRVAVESSRLVAEIASHVARPASWVVAGLDSTAHAERPPEDELLGGAALDHYADLLEAIHPVRRIPVELPLRLPEEMTGAWRRDAARQRMTMPRWVASRLRDVPDRCLRWEIAAARSRRSLGEWAYASSLRAFASSNA